MINWSHLPVDSLDGVSETELELISRLSREAHSEDTELERFIHFITDFSKNDDSIAGVELPDLPESVSASTEGADVNAIDKMELDSLPRTTRDQMLLHGQKFADYLNSLGYPLDAARTMKMEMLNEYLRLYYFRLAKPDGDPYSASSLVCIRAGIQRFFNYVVKREINIIDAPEFVSLRFVALKH